MEGKAETQSQARIDRRSFLRRAATVAWATPIISTVALSRAAAAVTCVPCNAEPPFEECVISGMPCCGDCSCQCHPLLAAGTGICHVLPFVANPSQCP
jgi:hypothetical protein